MLKFLSLRARIVGLLALSVLSVQAVSIYFLLDERYFLNQSQQVDAALYHFMATAALLEETPEYLHEDVLRAQSDNRHRFFIEAEPTLTQNDASGWIAALDDRYLDYLDKTDYAISEPIIKVEQGDSAENTNANRTGQKILIEAQLTVGTYLSGTFWKANPSVKLQYRMLALLMLSLVIAFGISSLIVIALTNPLKRLAEAAQKFGDGKKISHVKETGPRDIRQAAYAFNKMQTQLVEALQGQQHMVAAIGHDLRTPLTSMRLYAETLPESPQREKIIAKIEEMAVMLEAILSFAKVQADGGVPNIESFSISDLIQKLCDDYRADGKDCTLRVDSDIAPGEGDAENLKRAFANIIDNGLFYGGSVSVILTTTEAQTHIVIEDNGPGVKPEMLEQLTKPFFRTDTSRNQNIGGIGMGLALARAVIERHGGTLAFENTASGLRATVTLINKSH